MLAAESVKKKAQGRSSNRNSAPGVKWKKSDVHRAAEARSGSFSRRRTWSLALPSPKFYAPFISQTAR